MSGFESIVIEFRQGLISALGFRVGMALTSRASVSSEVDISPGIFFAFLVVRKHAAKQKAKQEDG